ncbi:MAG TPA: DUF5647 family protein [Thermomicrobiaceae bacterium]|nr:DUF5647 family protein [Thermomicrobiaceae bacterium]
MTDTIPNNIGIAFEFARSIVDDPTILDEIPDGATLVLVPDSDPKTINTNLELARAALERGEDVYLRHVHHASRNREPSLV